MTNEQAEKLFQAKQNYDGAKETYEALRDSAVLELRLQRPGESVESVKISVGRVVINVAYNDVMVSVAWERIVERIKEMFPKVSKVLANIMRGTYENDKGEKVPYVKPSPRAVLKVDVTD